MRHGLIVRLRPTGPWRFGSDSGARHEIGELYHSDSVFSAVTHAMARLGELEEWLVATASCPETPAVRFSSLYPWLGRDLYIVPPQCAWPHPSPAALDFRSARFVPLELVPALLRGQDLAESEWAVDSHSRCLLKRGRHGPLTSPFRISIRNHAAVDRLTRLSAEARRTAGVEFAEDAGLWLVAEFAGNREKERWASLVEAAFRLLADSGFGGMRSIGWGRSEQPEFTPGELPSLILPPPDQLPEGPTPAPEEEADPAPPPPPPQTGHWLLSLFRPGDRDAVDWNKGWYALTTRGGRVDSPGAAGQPKRLVRMVTEGSVLISDTEPAGSAADVAPEGAPHPVFRYGCPVSVPVLLREAV